MRVSRQSFYSGWPQYLEMALFAWKTWKIALFTGKYTIKNWKTWKMAYLGVKNLNLENDIFFLGN